MSNAVFPHVVPAEQLTQFRENGFVRTPGVFGPAELARYAAAVDTEVARRTAHDRRALADKTTYEQSFVQCMRLWETAPAVAPLTLDARLAGIATQLLDVAGVLLWQDQALYKEAGGRETTPHQDQTFWPIGAAPLVSAWIPFDTVTAHNGAMAYVPASHLAGPLKVVDITHRTQPYEILGDPALGGRRPQIVPAQPGDVIWHHGFTVHQAARNASDTTRRVFTVVYIASGSRRAGSWPGYPLDRDGVAAGEEIRGPGMPQLWPPPASAPEPPGEVSVPVGPQYQP